MSFIKVRKTGNNPAADQTQSTITSAQIRLEKEQYSLSRDQYLICDPPTITIAPTCSGIETLNQLTILQPKSELQLSIETTTGNLQLQSPPEGIKVAFSGQAKTVTIGLNRDIPLLTLKTNWLLKWISRDLFIVIYGALVGLIISWFKEKKN